MEFTEYGLELTRKESSDLSEVFYITALMNDWGPMSGVRCEPSEEEKNEAHRLSELTRPVPLDKKEAKDVVILEPHNFASISKIAELAIENSEKVVRGLCTPNVCDGYRSEWRPAAYRILAMTAEVSEVIKRKEQTTKRSS